LDIEEYWKDAVDLQQDMFKPHKWHQFIGFVLTDGVSISVVRETKDEPGETNTKCKCVDPRPLQQKQPAAQRAWLSYQPSYQLSFQPS
ncbi:hypothetical protein GGH16_005563, partial [Coemansia sp. RSA 560]